MRNEYQKIEYSETDTAIESIDAKRRPSARPTIPTVLDRLYPAPSSPRDRSPWRTKPATGLSTRP